MKGKEKSAREENQFWGFREKARTLNKQSICLRKKRSNFSSWKTMNEREHRKKVFERDRNLQSQIFIFVLLRLQFVNVYGHNLWSFKLSEQVAFVLLVH